MAPAARWLGPRLRREKKIFELIGLRSSIVVDVLTSGTDHLLEWDSYPGRCNEVLTSEILHVLKWGKLGGRVNARTLGELKFARLGFLAQKQNDHRALLSRNVV